MPARLDNQHAARQRELTEARKDLAWCVVKLDEDKPDAAFMTACVAVQRLGKVLVESEWQRVMKALDALKQHVSKTHQEQTNA